MHRPDKYETYPDHHEGNFARGAYIAFLMSALLWVAIIMAVITAFHVVGRADARPVACAGYGAAECAAAVTEARQ